MRINTLISLTGLVAGAIMQDGPVDGLEEVPETVEGLRYSGLVNPNHGPWALGDVAAYITNHPEWSFREINESIPCGVVFELLDSEVLTNVVPTGPKTVEAEQRQLCADVRSFMSGAISDTDFIHRLEEVFYAKGTYPEIRSLIRNVVQEAASAGMPLPLYDPSVAPLLKAMGVDHVPLNFETIQSMVINRARIYGISETDLASDVEKKDFVHGDVQKILDSLKEEEFIVE